MSTPSHTQALLREKLLSRQRELRALLEKSQPTRTSPQEVHDFKDAAAEEVDLSVDEVTAAHHWAELAQIDAALRRLETGHYGICQDCGEAISQERLLALPATATCARCQRVREARAAHVH